MFVSFNTHCENRKGLYATPCENNYKQYLEVNKSFVLRGLMIY